MSKRYWYVILTYIIMQLSGIIFVPLIYLTTPFNEYESTVYWSIISFIIGLAVVLVFMKPEMKRSYERNMSVGSTVLWIIGGFFIAYFAQIIASVIEMEVLGIATDSKNTETIVKISRATPLFIIIPVLVAPILEEIIFRKIIFGELYKKMNFFIAGFLSAVVFGIIHGEPQHLLIYASAGFAFAFLYVKTKRLIVPIVVHMALNAYSIILSLSLSPEDIERMQKELESLQTIIIGG